MRVKVWLGLVVVLASASAHAGINNDTFDRQVAKPSPAPDQTSSSDDGPTTLLSAPRLGLQTTPQAREPAWSIVLGGGYDKQAAGAAQLSVSYSWSRSPRLTLEPSFAASGSGLGGSASSGKLGFDVSIAPSAMQWKHLAIALDPEIDVDDKGDVTYIPAIFVKTTHGDNSLLKFTFSVAASTPCTSSDCGYALRLGAGIGRSFGKAVTSITLRPEVGAATFDDTRMYGGAVELGAGFPLLGRNLQLLLIPAASDLQAAGTSWSLSGKLVAAI